MKYLFLFILFSLNGYSQSLEEFYQQSKKAYEAHDYKQFLELMEKLDVMRPSHPALTYNLAVAYALNHNPESAVKTLRECVLMNNTIDFESDADFNNLKQHKDYEKLIQLKSDLGKTISNSERVATLSEKDLHPEGLLYLNKSKTWLATSIHKGKIVLFDINTGECKDWLNTGDMLSVFSIKADADEKYLWVATGAMPEMEHYDKNTQGRGEVLKIDIQSQKIVKRFPLEGNHVFGDLIIAKNGIVYVSDSGNADIYKIENDVFSKWLSLEKEAFNLQGVTFNDKGDTIFIADYFKGILIIPVSLPQERKWFEFPKNVSVKGIDGLVCFHDTLIAIQNGVKPIRVVQLFMNDKKEIITSVVIDNNRNEFNEPALGTIVDGNLYFFGNCPWSAYDKEGKMDVGKVLNPELYRFGLKD